jgi:hypothetical protein
MVPLGFPDLIGPLILEVQLLSPLEIDQIFPVALEVLMGVYSLTVGDLGRPVHAVLRVEVVFGLDFAIQSLQVALVFAFGQMLVDYFVL